MGAYTKDNELFVISKHINKPMLKLGFTRNLDCKWKNNKQNVSRLKSRDMPSYLYINTYVLYRRQIKMFALSLSCRDNVYRVGYKSAPLQSQVLGIVSLSVAKWLVIFVPTYALRRRSLPNIQHTYI